MQQNSPLQPAPLSPIRDALGAIRGVAIVWIVLSIVALPVGALALNSALSPTVGDNEMGDTIALGLGILLLVVGVAGLTFGAALAMLAKRSLSAQAEVRGSRRTVLVAGLAIALGEVLISFAVGGAASFLVGLSAAFAAAFMVVATASSRRVDGYLSGALAVVLLGVGLVPIWSQVSQNDAFQLNRDRRALIPADMDLAIDAAAAAAPRDWRVSVLDVKGKNVGSNNSRDLPKALVGHQLRGLIVVDCAGRDELEISTMRDGGGRVVVGTVKCRAEPQLLTFSIPDAPAGSVRPDYVGPPPYVLRLNVDPVPDEGPNGWMNRAMIMVALADAPDPDRDALLAAFVAAYGTEKPR